MSIHVLKQVLQLVPEVSGLVKRAYVEEEFPVHSKDATVTSALQLAYMTKVAHQPVDREVMIKVAKATRLHGVEDKVRELSNKLVKKASQANIKAKTTSQMVKEAEQILVSHMQGLFCMEKTAAAASDLYDEYKEFITEPAVSLYAGAGMLNKEAAVAAVMFRHKMTKFAGFEKMASIITGTNVDTLTVDNNRSIAKAIIEMEKKAGFYGRDIYKEIFMVKEAQINDATTVNLGPKSVSVTQLKTLGSATVSDILGADVGAAIDMPAPEMKAALEALPLGERQALARLIR